MREIRIAIISQRSEFSRFFELEAINFGFKTEVFTKNSAELSDFDLCILDSKLNTTPIGFQGICVIVGETDGSNETDGERIYLSYPTSLRELQKLYSSIMYGEFNVVPESDTGGDGKIYFYRERKNLISYCGTNIQLSEYEAKLLERLCASCKTPVSRRELNALLGATDGNIADVYVCKLRKRLETVSSKRLIFTVRGQGYKIVTDLEWN